MAYDEELAERVRERLAERPDITERKMFGGLSFLLNGNLACGVIGNELCVRTGPEGFDEAMELPGARIFDMTGRPMRGWVMVGADGFHTELELEAWVRRGVDYAATLPPK